MAQKNRGKPSWVRFTGVGVEFAGVVVVFALIGNWLDGLYDWKPWGVLVGLVLGLFGGTYNLIKESLAASRDAAREDDSSSKSRNGDRP